MTSMQKNQVNRTRKTCLTRYRISITIFAKRVLSASHRAGCTRPKKNGTQVNGYNFVTVHLIYMKFCRYKDKILNDKHGKK